MHCCIVKRDNNFSTMIPLFLMIILTIVLSTLSAFVFDYIPFIIAIVGIGLSVWLSPNILKTEYEYNLEGDSFSVALIRDKSSRKELFCCDISHLVSCAPYSSQMLQGEKINATSSENSDYIAVFSEDGKIASVIFSPSENFVNELRLLAPSKVKLNIL